MSATGFHNILKSTCFSSSWLAALSVHDSHELFKTFSSVVKKEFQLFLTMFNATHTPTFQAQVWFLLFYRLSDFEHSIFFHLNKNIALNLLLFLGRQQMGNGHFWLEINTSLIL